MYINSIIDTIVSGLVSIFDFIIGHPVYIVVVIAAIITYAVASHILFRTKGYQPRDRSMCILSIAGKERSLEYLQNFTHMSSEQIATIKYLRENEPVPLNVLSKRFGKRNVMILIRQDYINLT
jgi:hypothetical protein